MTAASPPMQIEIVLLDSITLDPANVRTHDRRNLDAIKGSLKRFGPQWPLAIVDGDGIVRAGNGRIVAARELGWTEAPVVRTALTGSDAIAFAIADNRTAELAAWDEAALAQTLSQLTIDDAELALVTGFSEKELEDLVSGVTGATDIVEDESPEPPANPVTKPGDLWLLGEHRLLCGDSTKAEDVRRLMDGGGAGRHDVYRSPVECCDWQGLKTQTSPAGWS